MFLFDKRQQNTHKITESTIIKISGSNIMEIKIVIIHILCILLILLGTGCIEEEYPEVLETSRTTRSIHNTEYTPEPQYSPEMQQLIDFLKVDKVNEESFYEDSHRGLDYYTCVCFSRDLAKNAKEYDIDMGGM